MSDLERDAGFVDASEIGEYSYCRRQWWLRRVEGIEPVETVRMQQGVAYHQAHWHQVRKAVRYERVVPVLIALVITTIFLIWLLAVSGIGGG